MASVPEQQVTSDQPSNSERILIAIVREIAAELNVEVTTAFTDWVVRLHAPNGKRATIFGYDFGLNQSSAAQVADDKAATSETLQTFGINCVAHHLVFRPDFARFSDQASTYVHAAHLFETLGQDVVCKNNRGTGGVHVYRARNVPELENALYRIFTVHYAAALSPYVEASTEYRVIMIDGTATAVFGKNRPAVVGDGQRSVAELAARKYPNRLVDSKTAEIDSDTLRRVPAEGELTILNWRHNLGQGASPDFVTDAGLEERLTRIAEQSLSAIGLRCGSVDVLAASDNLQVLEVNNGIMVENLARSGVQGASLAKATYNTLIRKLLEL